jgi:hypothetical protein
MPMCHTEKIINKTFYGDASLQKELKPCCSGVPCIYFSTLKRTGDTFP